MSNAPQNQNQPTQNIPFSNQTPSKTAQVAGNVKKDEPAARMENEGGNCSASDKKSTQDGCN